MLIQYFPSYSSLIPLCFFSPLQNFHSDKDLPLSSLPRVLEGKVFPLWTSEVAQSCPTFCDPMNCSLPGSSIHGIFQARILEWVTISFSRGSSWPRDWTQVFHIAGRCFTIWAIYFPWESTKKSLQMTDSSELNPVWRIIQ